MKQKFLLMLLAGTVSAFSATAQKAGDVVINAGDFKSVSIAGNMDVVLLTDAAETSNLSVSKEAAKQLDITLSGETLKFEPKYWSTNGTVYIKVRDLQKLSLGENTVVHIKGVITTPEFELFLHDDSKAYFKTTGKIKAHAMGNTEVTIQPVFKNTSIEKAL